MAAYRHASIFGTHTAHADGKEHTVYEIRVVNSDNAIHLCSRRFRDFVALAAAVGRPLDAWPHPFPLDAAVVARRRRALDEYVRDLVAWLPNAPPEAGPAVRDFFGVCAAPAAPALPDEDLLICPITQEEFYEPVITADGMTYERSAIEKWLEHNFTSPSTNAELPHRHVVPNFALRALLSSRCTELEDASDELARVRRALRAAQAEAVCERAAREAAQRAAAEIARRAEAAVAARVEVQAVLQPRPMAPLPLKTDPALAASPPQRGAYSPVSLLACAVHRRAEKLRALG
jgi:hypothetical protein